MGSGDRFRFGKDYELFMLGLIVIPNGEHKLSIHLNFGFWHFYFGFGKGYDE